MRQLWKSALASLNWVPSLHRPGGGHLQSLALFSLNAGQTIFAPLDGFGVGHAENVVRLNAAGETAVAWDGLAKFQACLSLLNTVESVNSLLLRLGRLAGLKLLSRARLEGVLNLGFLNTEESMDARWRDWLLLKVSRKGVGLLWRSGASGAQRRPFGRRSRASSWSGRRTRSSWWCCT